MEWIDTKRISVRIQDPEGLHVHNAARIFEAAAKLDANIWICMGNKTARADKILELMALEASAGTLLEILAGGKDAETAVDTIAQILQDI